MSPVILQHQQLRHEPPTLLGGLCPDPITLPTPCKLLGAPGLTTRNKKLLGAPGIAARSKDATRGSVNEDCQGPPRR